MGKRASRERIEQVREQSAVQAFLLDPRYEAVRQGIVGIYAKKGLLQGCVDENIHPAADFLRTVFRVLGDDSIGPDERMQMLQGFTELDHRAASELMGSLQGIYLADQLALRGAERDAIEIDAKPSLPDSERFQRERITTGSDAGRNNAVRFAFDKHARGWDENQKRWIDSARHLAVRDAMDKSLGGRNVDARLDNVEISNYAVRERDEAVERAQNHEPSLRDSLEAAFNEGE